MDNILIHLYQQQRLPHALLLVTSSAQANNLYEELTTQLQLNPADYLLFNEPVALKVADARQIRQFVELTRFTSPIKLVAITDANQLTPEAANALLKTLEEPPAHTHFILATNQLDNLLPTIRSRCQIHHLATRESSTNSTTTPLTRLPLPEAFNLSKELAASDTPLPTIFQAWLASTTNPVWQQLILRYLPAASTTVNRRLLLDNFLLDLYNAE